MQAFPEPPGDDDPVTTPEVGGAGTFDAPPGDGTGSGSPAEAPAPPAAPPPTRRRWPWVAVVAIAAVLAAGGGALTWQAGHGTLPAEQAPRATTAGAPSTSAGRAESHRASLATLLAARSRAVLGHDKAAFLATVDPAEKAFRDKQATVFDRVARVPLGSWEYDYAGEGPGLGGARAAALPKGSWVARVILHYKYAGGDSPVDREQYLTVVPRDGRWLIAGDDDVAASGLATERDIWDLGPIDVVRGRHSLVIGDARPAALRDYADDADRSVRDVDAVWKKDWSRRPVVIVPKSQADMATIIGSDGDGLDQIAAVTTGYSVSGPTRGDRVVINPSAWKGLGDLGRRVVMAHEVTHLATRAITVHAVPIWLSEGFADYVAYQAVDVPTRVVASDVLDQVREGKGPKRLPEDGDFDAARGDLAPAYEGAWLACRMLAERYGQAKLIALYVALADRDSGLPEKDIRRVLGISEDKLVADWRAYLAQQARR